MLVTASANADGVANASYPLDKTYRTASQGWRGSACCWDGAAGRSTSIREIFVTFDSRGRSKKAAVEGRPIPIPSRGEGSFDGRGPEKAAEKPP